MSQWNWTLLILESEEEADLLGVYAEAGEWHAPAMYPLIPGQKPFLSPAQGSSLGDCAGWGGDASQSWAQSSQMLSSSIHLISFPEQVFLWSFFPSETHLEDGLLK